MITKADLLDVFNALPDGNLSADAVIEQIIILDKINKGLDAMHNGKVITLEELENEIDKW